MDRVRPLRTQSAGWILGPLAWGMVQLAAYSATPWVCGDGKPFATVLFDVLALAVAATGGWLSFRAYRGLGEGGEIDDPRGGERASRFVAAIGAMTAVLFAVAILMQGAAGMIFTGCER